MLNLTSNRKENFLRQQLLMRAFREDTDQYGKKELQLDNLNVKNLESGATTSSVNCIEHQQ